MFDIHITNWAVFGDSSPQECIERTAVTGAEGVEFFGWDETDIAAIASVANEHGVSVVSTGALGVAANASGEGPSLTDPTLREQAVDDIEESLERVAPLDTDVMVLTVGPARPTISRAAQHNAIVHVLRDAAPIAAAHGVTLVIEPLNTQVDHPGYFLRTTDQAVEIVESVNHQNIKLLYDVYHQQITEGSLVDTINEHHEHIGMYHLADVPGRHEPGTGEINYRTVLETIADTGYGGSVGLEYVPTSDPEATVQNVLALRDAFDT
jgi:hydroxypyruvate isomerase